MINHEIANGCTDPKTFDLLERLTKSPHVVSWTMFPDEDNDCEVVSVTFLHYVEEITIDFNSETELGEVLIPKEGDANFENATVFGVITVEKFEELLGKLPHIIQYLEDEGIEETLHWFNIKS